MTTEEIASHNDSETFEFTGHRGDFFQILLVNLILTIVTLGIYRFWAKTKVRKFIWSNVRFMGDPLEYTGKGSELLLGFLIVLAVLFPLGLIYNGIQFLVPPGETALHIGLEVLYYFVLFALIQVGFYRAWRYRMSRTTWRGIRLGLDGSTWAFLRLSVGWTVLTILTLGVAYPWMAVELWRYQITHTRIGETVIEFRGSGKDLILPWLLVVFPGLFIFFSNLVNLYLMFDVADIGSTSPVPTETSAPVAAFHIQAIPTWLLIMNAVAFIALLVSSFWYSIRLARYQISGMSLEEASITSQLPFGRLMAFGGIALGVFAVPVIIIGVLMFPASGTAQGTLIALAMIGLFAGFILFPIAWTLIYTFEFIKQLFITITITNPAAFETVVQSAAESQKTGEGLADALDIGGL